MTIAQQLKIKEFPFIVKDSDGNRIYFEDSTGWWSKWEWVDGKVIRYEDSKGYWVKREYAEGKIIRWEDSNGIIMDYRPKTDVQKAIDLLTKEGLLRDGKILKN